MPKLITLELIASETPRGRGTEENLSRLVTQYHTTDGRLMLEYDPCADDGAVSPLIEELRTITKES